MFRTQFIMGTLLCSLQLLQDLETRSLNLRYQGFNLHNLVIKKEEVVRNWHALNMQESQYEPPKDAGTIKRISRRSASTPDGKPTQVKILAHCSLLT